MAQKPKAPGGQGRSVAREHLLLAVLCLAVGTALLLASCKMLGGGEAGFAVLAAEGEAPFAALAADEVASVDILLQPGGSKVIEDEGAIAEMVGILQKARTYEQGEPPEGMAGQSVAYTLRMKDGKERVVFSFAGHLSIDGASYRSDSLSGSAMRRFANNALMTGFAEVVFEPGDRPFDVLLTDGIQGVQFGNRFGEVYVLDDPEEAAVFIELLEGIAVKERYATGSAPVRDIYSNYEYTFSVITEDVDFHAQVKSPTFSLYRHGYLMDEATAAALGEAARPHLARIESAFDS
ncbi:MAG: hypothetical protein LBL86_09195 [Coriobacteriales bacterium]|jgi:hypothetical protein|nr:hypothetical protein [Coriobacteriales bacterium]